MIKTMSNVDRLPVVWKSKPLMPMRWKRIKLLLKSKEAVIKYNKNGIKYVKLLRNPSGITTQNINLGLDPGSHFDGVSITSKYSHLINLELIHNKSIKDKISTRAGYRRLRRTRLRHRPIRFSNRTSEKLVPTIRSMVDFRIKTINSLIELYPINKIVIEDVRYNHYNDSKGIGSGFSQVEIGKTKLYKYISEILRLPLVLISGYETKEARVGYFGKEVKLKDKGSKSFYAHGVDSFILANAGFDFKGVVNTSIKFITKVIMIRRHLHKVKRKIGDSKKYFRYAKGGIKKFFIKLGKTNICRVKLPGIHSNHPKEWIKINNKKDVCEKHFKCNYGGTIAIGNTQSIIPLGISKKAIWSNLIEYRNKLKGKILGYLNRNYEVYN